MMLLESVGRRRGRRRAEAKEEEEEEEKKRSEEYGSWLLVRLFKFQNLFANCVLYLATQLHFRCMLMFSA